MTQEQPMWSELDAHYTACTSRHCRQVAGVFASGWVHGLWLWGRPGLRHTLLMLHTLIILCGSCNCGAGWKNRAATSHILLNPAPSPPTQ